MRSKIANNNKLDFVNISIEIRVDISFKTRFLFGYYNELKEEKIIELNGRSYSREIFYRGSSLDFTCMLFVYNEDFEENQVAQIQLFQDNRNIENRFFHLSNTLPYDGWFFLEKKVSTL